MNLLSGKALKSAVNGFAKKAATFSASVHLLGASALAHAVEHNDACYVTSIYTSLPLNARLGFQKWATEFGNVKFDATALTFKADAKKPADLDSAKRLSPLDYQKVKSEKAKPADSADAAIEAFQKRMAKLDNVDASVKSAVEGLSKIGSTAPMSPLDAAKAALAALSAADREAVSIVLADMIIEDKKIATVVVPATPRKRRTAKVQAGELPLANAA